MSPIGDALQEKRDEAQRSVCDHAYFGYLRRTADTSHLNWIQTMNQTNSDYRVMMTSLVMTIPFMADQFLEADALPFAGDQLSYLTH